jgi:hypothetical protein
VIKNTTGELRKVSAIGKSELKDETITFWLLLNFLGGIGGSIQNLLHEDAINFTHQPDFFQKVRSLNGVVTIVTFVFLLYN